jgi:hypothetical protein
MYVTYLSTTYIYIYIYIKANEMCKSAKNMLAKYMQDYAMGIKLCTLHSVRSSYFADQ